jgi:hypothetical protein
LKRLDPVMLALIADVGSNLFYLRLAHRKGSEVRLPEKARKQGAPAAKSIVRAFLEMSDKIAQRLGPCEKKQSVQMVGLGVDFDGGTTEAFERAAR